MKTIRKLYLAAALVAVVAGLATVYAGSAMAGLSSAAVPPDLY